MMSDSFPLPAIKLTSVSKRFRLAEGNTLQEFLPAFFRGSGFREPFFALRDVSLTVERGECLGILGHNGSGKSTLLKLIAGVMVPTLGSVSVTGRVCPLLGLGAGFHPDLTGRENIYLNASLLGLSNADVRARFADIVDFAEIEGFVDTPVKRYSSGMFLRLAFAIAVQASPDILIVDEILAVGDQSFQEKCLARMEAIKNEGVTIVVVSHNVRQVESFCSRVVVLSHGRVIDDGEPVEAGERYLASFHHAS
jgi:ABC-2 type transport system ATP-binding protein